MQKQHTLPPDFSRIDIDLRYSVFCVACITFKITSLNNGDGNSYD